MVMRVEGLVFGVLQFLLCKIRMPPMVKDSWVRAELLLCMAK